MRTLVLSMNAAESYGWQKRHGIPDSDCVWDAARLELGEDFVVKVLPSFFQRLERDQAMQWALIMKATVVGAAPINSALRAMGGE
jgi:hypothetical protein